MRPQMMPTPALDQGTPAELRDRVRAYFRNGWETYERLFDVMASDEAYFTQADPLRHPLIFYLGHTAVFFINKMILAKVIRQRVDPHLESIFAIGVDEMSWDDLNDENYDWPTVAETWEYRRQVRQVIEKAIDELPLDGKVGWDDPFWVIMMGSEHERIHLETSSVLIRQLPLNMLRQDENWTVCDRAGEPAANTMLEVPGGSVTQGKSRTHSFYGWDNEYGELVTQVAGFKAARTPVTNREFQEFIDDGGYENPEFWTDEGWAWRQYRQATAPLFWITGDGPPRLRCMTHEIPMPWNWPVEVNYLEAKAYCHWLAERTGQPVRLPTEAEWYRLLEHSGLAECPTWGAAEGNVNLEFASGCPVDEHLHGGFSDVVGNAWQWTETPITGFPGFAVHPLYDDFSTPTFDMRHNLIKGGSWISTGNEATPWSRYAFRRHFYQHTGFRPVISAQKVELREDVYETDDLVGQYCEFHYGDDYYGVPNFPKAVAELAIAAMAGRKKGRALDLGCATGRSTFELARSFNFVTGIDFSARFIKVSHEMQQRGSIRYAIPTEGELVSYHEKTLDQFGLADTTRKVEFWQGDAHNLKPQFTNYDLVLACNLVDRLYHPVRFLEDIARRINPGGLLVILSPYTWLEEFTPRDNWLGGRKVDGENVTTLDGLQAALKPIGLRRIGQTRDVPFVIRETARKFQHTLSQMSIWEKNEA
ncbi:SAM-dependent methyltransferase [bacterium DOLZORAL124_64_63]|nr:MAG: SAM-dependent methyltransferase [bacterium DOLZORAL124_64_63]